jgi:hypothetical protein
MWKNSEILKKSWSGELMTRANEKNAAKMRKKKKYFTAEYTALKLLEYMILEEDRGPFSVHHLMRIRGLGWQRRDRIRSILDQFARLGWITASGNPPRYQVTKEGKIAYNQLGVYMLEFFAMFMLENRKLPTRIVEPFTTSYFHLTRHSRRDTNSNRHKRCKPFAEETGTRR